MFASRLISHARKGRQRRWSLLLIGILLSMPVQAAKLHKVTVQLSWKYQYEFAAFITALEKGYYREAGLDVVLHEGGPDINPVDEVVQGHADYGVFSSALIVEYGRGKPVVALAALMQHSPVALIVHVDRGINSVLDLADREIAVSADTRDEIRAYLQSAGLSDEHIRFVDEPHWGLKNLQRFDAFSAFTSNEGYYTRQYGNRFGLFYPRSAGIDLFGNILFTSHNYLQHNRKEVEAFRAATLRGLSYALNHHEEITSLILKRYNSQGKSRAHLLYEARTITELTRPEIVDPGYMGLGRWQHVKQVYASQGHIPADLDLKPFIYNANSGAVPAWLYGLLAALAIVLLITAMFYWQARRYNRRLMESESKFRDLFEKNPDPCWLIENNVMVECNEKAASVLGYADAATLYNRHPASLSPDYQPNGRLSEEMAEEMMALAQENGVHRFEWTQQRRNGQSFPVEITLARFRQGGRDMLYGIWRDITERKRSERLKDEFISTVSHELRTPLTAIRGTLKFLASGRLDGKNEQSREMLRIAENNSEKLFLLINDLLDIDKLENSDMRLNMSCFGLGTFLDECRDENQAYARQHDTHIELASDIDLSISADRQRLKQVMANLLSNACKFNSPGQAVEIGVEVQDSSIRIDVRDYGFGIPPTFQDKLFDKFTQADSSTTRQSGGTGLGLSIVKRIVELHGGMVDFTTAEGKGTTFHVHLPLQKLTA
jgi:PAS domain S-box-containing protein